MDSPGVCIDEAHARLLHGLVCAHKPATVLEFGFGGGRSAQAIVDALEYNQIPPHYLIVDNWRDWGGKMPEVALDFWQKAPYWLHFFDISEREFATEYSAKPFDFIFSDADHAHAQEWFQRTYDVLLAPGGVLCYHDVCNFPNLWEIVEECKARGLRYVVFDKNSVEGEACQRGLLCIFKSVENE